MHARPLTLAVIWLVALLVYQGQAHVIRNPNKHFSFTNQWEGAIDQHKTEEGPSSLALGEFIQIEAVSDEQAQDSQEPSCASGDDDGTCTISDPEPPQVDEDGTCLPNTESANFTFEICGATVHFNATDRSNTILSYVWDFGEHSCRANNSATGPSVEHTYTAPGGYRVTLTITSSSGQVIRRSHVVLLGQHRANLQADFSYHVNGNTVTVTGVNNGTITEFNWDFGDRSGLGESVTTGNSASHTYTVPGTYVVTLNVKDDRGATSAVAYNVTPTVADFVCQISGDVVSCNARTSGAIARYFWDFGDQASGEHNIATGASASHTYTVPGAYNITFTATDESGASVSRTRSFIPTVADFTFEIVGDTVTGRASTSGTVTSYLWDFGEGNQTTGGTVSHTYTTPGTYILRLTVTDANGANSTRTYTITPTVADFTFELFGDTIDVNARSSSGAITSYTWNFGESSEENNQATGSQRSHKFSAPGTYAVVLTVTDEHGNTATRTQTITSTVSLGAGNLEFTAIWDRDGHGDLLVRTPKTKVIYYDNRGPSAATDFGALEDLDTTSRGPENIFWGADATPPLGIYHVCFNANGFNPVPSPEHPVSAVIAIRRPGHPVEKLRKTFTEPTRNETCSPSLSSYVGTYNYGEGDAALIADFTHQVDGGVIRFDAISSSGNIAGYSWNFGDEANTETNVAEGETASHTYTTPGTFTVRLTIRDEHGTTTEKTHTVIPTVADFEFEVVGNTVNCHATSSGAIANYFWNFGEQSSGEDNIAHGTSVSHTYNVPGTYTVTLTITDEAGATSTRTYTFTPTVADFNFEITGNTVSCNASTSGSIASYTWDFGDPTSPENIATGDTISHTYTVAGSYTVTLTITDTDGATVTRTYTITPTIAEYSFEVTGDTIHFDATGSSGTISEYSWNFGDPDGDDNIATGSSITHTYTTPGAYTVTLTITDESGVTSVVTYEVIPTIPSYEFSVAGETVTFSATGSSGSITSYSWDFGEQGSGDSNAANGSSVSHTYSNPGTYTATLTITDASGTAVTTTREITPAVSDFTFEINGETVTCGSRSSGQIVSHFWDFGDQDSGADNVASGSTATHTYTTPGIYTVRLTITDATGTTSTRTHSITPTVAGFTYSIVGDSVSFDATSSSGTISRYAWNFGEQGQSNTATGSSVTHAYTIPGTYTISLTVTDEDGATSTKTHTLTPTVADFTMEVFGDTIDVDATASSGTLTSFAWNFGDQASGEDNNEAAGSTVSHKFSAPGTYTVTLTVTDQAGATATRTRSVTASVSLGLGNLGFTAIWDRRGDGDLLVKTPKQKVISYQNRGPSAGTDYGRLDVDDTTGTGPENIYWALNANPPRGTYHICFNAYNFTPPPSPENPVEAVISIRRPGAGVVRRSHSITQAGNDQTCAPGAGNYVGSYTFGEGPTPLTANFTCEVVGGDVRCDAISSEGDILGYTWDFGDEASGTNNTAIGETASHTYTTPGTFSINLTITGEAEATSVKTHAVIPTVSDFTCEVTGDTINCTSRSSGTIESHFWDFGDQASGIENVGTGSSASHTYTRPGTYTARLTVTDAAGATSTRTHDIIPTVADFTFEVVGDSVNVNAGGSSGTITSYAWDFGDGSTEGETTGEAISHRYHNAGTFNVKLTVTDDAGNSAARTIAITPTVAEFSFEIDGNTVTLNAGTSSGTITGYSWDFGEETSGAENVATGSTASHTYTTAGTFTITVTVTDATGASTTRTHRVTPTVAEFAFEIAGDTVTAITTSSGNVTAYSWNFGDQASGEDNVATESEVSHTYTVPGTYTITLTITDQAGATVTRTHTLTPTVAEFGLEVSGEVVTCNATGSSGTIASYVWDFGDDTRSSAQATGTVSHRYAQPGEYTITLTITDEAGDTVTRTHTVVPTVATFTYQVNGKTVTVDASGSSGNINSYSWTFGEEGTTNAASGASASHTYTAPGTFTATVTVTDTTGASSTRSLDITPTIANFVFDISGDTVNYNARSSSGAARYMWNFGETDSPTNVASGPTATHTYSAAGTYTTTLAISDNNGTTDSKEITVIPVIPDFGVESTGETLHFDASISSGTITSYSWNFGEAGSANNTATGSYVSHRYSAPGRFTVTLTIKDNRGATFTKTQTVAPVVAEFTSQAVGDLVTFTAKSADTIASYVWDFGDQNSTDNGASGPTVSHRYTVAGTYTARLTVTDTEGQTATRTYTINPTIPEFSIRITGNTIRFDASRSSGPITRYSWNFGDGTTGTGNTAVHAYGTQEDSYIATLTIVDDTGYSTTKTYTVVPTKASFTVEVAGDTVTVDASPSKGAISAYSWNFGDAGSANNNDTNTTASHRYTNPGTYNVTLSVTDASETIVTRTIAVIPVIAEISSELVESGTLRFTVGRTSGTIARYTWNFGDEGSRDNIATGNTANHTFSSAGTYTVTLTVTDANGVNSTRTQTVTPTVAEFTFRVTGDTASFDASNSSAGMARYSWNFGESNSTTNTATGVTASHRYATAGTARVTLSITDNDGKTVTKTRNVTPLIADFSAQVVGDTVTFRAVAAETFESYAWNFGDTASGALNTATGASTSHRYTTPGTYTVTLTITDIHGATVTRTYSLTPTIADYSVRVVGNTINFDASRSSGTIRTYSWNFGDPSSGSRNTASGATSSHTYSSGADNYTVTLTIQDATGYSGTRTYTVVPTKIDYTLRVEADTVYVDASNSKGEITAYSWDFGETGSSTNIVTDAAASHKYITPSTYTVKITVTDASGTTLTKTSTITPMVASFSSQVTGSGAMRFTASAHAAITSYTWNFGDASSGASNTATGSTATHNFAAAGQYTVTLIVRDNTGATSTRSQTITPTVADYSFTINGDTISFNAGISSTGMRSYQWSFGDGTTATGITTSKRYTTAGTYTVTLTITDTNGITATRTQSVTPRIADFTFTTAGDTVTVRAGTAPTFTNYAWNFGETGSSTNTVTGPTASSTTHRYATPGTYQVTLTITDAGGAAISKTYAVTPTMADFTSTVSGNTVRFDASRSSGSIRTYSWNFGDSTTGSGASVSKTYTSSADSFAVTLTIQDTTGYSTTKSYTVVPTKADFTFQVSGDTVAVNAGNSKGAIASYSWTFGESGSSTNTATGVTSSHRYATPGTFTITLRVTDASGAAMTKSTSVAPLIADFTVATVSSGTLRFTSAGSGTGISSYSWNFGDTSSGASNTATGSPVNHAFTRAGTYTVTLVVRDSAGGSSTDTQTVTPTVAAFTYTVRGDTVTFDAGSSSSGMRSYSWNFGDGSTGSGVSTTKRYTSAGTFTVTLSVVDNTGATVTTSQTVAPTIAVMSCNLVGDTVDCDASRSSGAITAYSWNFGNGRTGAGRTISNKYTTRGTYTVTLTVTDSTGGTSTTSGAYTVSVILGSGSLQFTLQWSRAGDGDFAVTTPNGKTIYYQNKGPNANTDLGQLDVDNTSGTGPENIFWPNNVSPPRGRYHVCFITFNFSGYPVTATITIRRPEGAPLVYTKTMYGQDRNFNCQPGASTYVTSYDYYG